MISVGKFTEGCNCKSVLCKICHPGMWIPCEKITARDFVTHAVYGPSDKHIWHLGIAYRYVDPPTVTWVSTPPARSSSNPFYPKSRNPE